MKQRIEKKLRDGINPRFLEVINNSAAHYGHLGDNGSGETHFAVTIEFEDKEKMTKIQAHRKINGLLKEEFNRGLHALEIKVI